MAAAPSQVSQARRDTFIEYLRSTGSIKHSATMAGLSANNLYVERKTNHELAEAWEEALQEYAGQLHKELQDAALGLGRWTKPDIRGIIKLNEAHNPELFAPKREYTTIVNVGGDVQTRIPGPARPPIEAEYTPVDPPKQLPE